MSRKSRAALISGIVFPVLAAVLFFEAAAQQPATPQSGTVPASSSPGARAFGAKQTKQVSVKAESPETQTSFYRFADQLDRNFRQLIRDTSDWIFPIAISVTGSLADVVSGRSAVTEIVILPDNRFQLKVHVRLSNSFRREDAAREIIKALIFERMLRPWQKNPGGIAGKELKVPEWLIRGIDEQVTWRHRGRPSELYAGIVRSRQVLSLDEILKSDPAKLDSVSAAILYASASALIGALLDQPSGPQNFREFLGGMAGVAGEEMGPYLRRHFPGLRGSAGALEKWWSLQIAHMGEQQAWEYLSAVQTEALLDEALTLQFGIEPQKPPSGIGKILPRMKPGEAFIGSIHDFDRFLGRKDCLPVLERSRLKLRALSLRCFPLYRSVIIRYESVIVALIDGKKRGLGSDLKKIDGSRNAVNQTMQRVADYMNYYEATRAEGSSKTFENYRETRKQLESYGKPRRDDRISKYLDALELEFDGEGE